MEFYQFKKDVEAAFVKNELIVKVDNKTFKIKF